MTAPPKASSLLETVGVFPDLERRRKDFQDTFGTIEPPPLPPPKSPTPPPDTRPLWRRTKGKSLTPEGETNWNHFEGRSFNRRSKRIADMKDKKTKSTPTTAREGGGAKTSGKGTNKSTAKISKKKKPASKAPGKPQGITKAKKQKKQRR
jgi:hypothetical protein